MARNLEKWKAFGPLFTVLWSFLLASIFVSAERSLKQESLSRNATRDSDSDLLSTFVNFIWQANKSGYHHVWPDLKFNWQIVVGSIIGFFGAAFGSVGGVGGGGIFVPMLSLIIGFDPKSATAISKCMIMGAAVSTVYYNLKLRHPTIDMPIIDYDLAVLIQPMLMLGISIGVAFNVLFADWMEAAKRLETNGDGKEEAEYKLLPGGPSNNTEKEAKDLEEPEVSIIENVCWKEFGLLIFVWIAFLAVQIIKEYTTTCSTSYWVVNLLQVPVSFGVSGYEAVSLYKGWRKIGSKGDEGTNFKVHQLLTYGLFGVLAGMVGGLLGLGGGFIMGPLFLELGVPPQVSSATATFAMMFSSSMSVVEYYLLKRFPVPYALYFVAVATVAAFIGQHVVRKLIIVLGRASIIIFILSFTIFVSAISLGGVGISNMVGKIQRHEYMGFENLCKYEV
ncbi:UNVERIFIED_CONTAM: Sulfite exporter TauE/SafE family protein 3 [Sesamum angustifolium]|uniref:Sulfite exporter TauE/SafE family protein 3 n=1 Tax=Sesamum angustifolium TaxID=2727405 RepID=A0AAW2MJN9_9LAMI